MDWNPIKTAPKDGTVIVAARLKRNGKPGVYMCYSKWDGDCWVSDVHGCLVLPTHWKPIAPEDDYGK